MPTEPREFPKRNSKSEQLSVRLPHEQLAAIDALREQLQTATPWVKVRRADVLRLLLGEALQRRSEKTA